MDLSFERRKGDTFSCTLYFKRKGKNKFLSEAVFFSSHPLMWNELLFSGLNNGETHSTHVGVRKMDQQIESVVSNLFGVLASTMVCCCPLSFYNRKVKVGFTILLFVVFQQRAVTDIIFPVLPVNGVKHKLLGLHRFLD